jgi:predicted HD superfamily hydrolase involved in NAD metabolism
MQCSEKNRIIEYIERNLTEKRRIHTYAVAEEAKKLAERYGEDMERAEVSALFHDFFRGASEQALNGYVRQLGLNQMYLDNANLAHSKIAAYIMEKDYHIKDRDIINAVSYHTTGRANMTKLEKIIYLADAIEPNRLYPGVEEIREMAYQDLDAACLLSLQNSVDFINSKGLYLDQDTVMARDSLKDKINIEKGEKA